MISIIIPHYNQPEALNDCLQSILAQTHKDYEVIIVDDGSKIDPAPIIAGFKDRLALRFIKHENNKGAPAARNTGFKAAGGDYLLFCDADAVLEPNTLEEMLIALGDNPEASYAYSSFLWGRKLFRAGEWSEEKLNSGPYIHTVSLIRREHFPEQGWDESLKRFMDWDLWLRMLADGKKGVWINKVLFKIKTGGTISSWLPGFAYKILPMLPAVKKYKKAMLIIKNKHGLK